MTTDLETATAAPATIKIGDKEFSMRPLTLGASGRFGKWWRKRHKAEYIEALAEAGKANAEIWDAMRQYEQPGTQDVFNAMVQPDGLAYAIWLAVQQDDTTVKLEDVEQSLTIADALEQLIEGLGIGDQDAASGEVQERTKKDTDFGMAFAAMSYFFKFTPDQISAMTWPQFFMYSEHMARMVKGEGEEESKTPEMTNEECLESMGKLREAGKI